MIYLNILIQERLELEQKLRDMKENYEATVSYLTEKINGLKVQEIINVDGIDSERLNIGKSTIFIEGNPWLANDQHEVLAERAIEHLSMNVNPFYKGCLGNKRYDGFHQSCDCEYGYGPKHGHVTDSIGLTRTRRLNKEPLGLIERDACIYYIKMYPRLKEIEQKVAEK